MGCVSSKLLMKQRTHDDGDCPPDTRVRKRKTRDHPRRRKESYQTHIIALTSTSYGMLSMGPSTPRKQQEMSTGPSTPRKHWDISKAGTFSELYSKISTLNSPPELVNAVVEIPKGGRQHKILQNRIPEEQDVSDLHCTIAMKAKDHPASPIQETIDVHDLMKGLEDDALNCLSLTASEASNAAVLSEPCMPKCLQRTHTVPKVDAGKEDGHAKENNGSVKRSSACCRTPFGDTNACFQLSDSPNEAETKTSKRKDTESDMIVAVRKLEAARKTSSPTDSKHVPSSGKVKLRPRHEEKLPTAANSSPLFDPALLASYEKALENASENHWKSLYDDTGMRIELSCDHSKLHRRKLYDPLHSFAKKCPPRGENTVVLYTTTLRGIRKTFEDCNKVRSILQSFNLGIDERDVSMHLKFLHELRQLMGRQVPLPKLFIKGRYIGGKEEVSKLFENDRLAELVEGLPLDGGVCDGCAGVRFVPCMECNGSCKLVGEGTAVSRCPRCNENGLLQCPICS